MLLTLQQYADVVESLQTVSTHDGNERRQHNRIDVQAMLNLALLDGTRIVRRLTAITRDVSMGGVGLMQAIALKQDQQFLCCLPAEMGRTCLVVICKAVFCRTLADGLFGIGAEFEAVASGELLNELARLENAERERIQKLVLK